MKIWDKEKIILEIKNYKSYPDIRNKNPKLYSAIARYKLSNEVYRILGKTGNRYNKCIYSYEFSDNSVYVGLTYNIDERQKNRNKNNKDSVTKHIIETGLIPIRKQLTDYIDVDKAIKLEGFYVEKYRNEGWIILNKVKTGTIGGVVIKWNKNTCASEALKYKTKIEFRNGSPSAYVTAKREKWLNDICVHMLEIKKSNGYWTKEKCAEVANKYISLHKFENENQSCYVVAKRNGWLLDIIKHMNIDIKKSVGYWTKERCAKFALQSESKIDFRKRFPKAYDAARKCDFYNEITKHLVREIKKEWTFEECKEVTKEIKNRSMFYSKHSTMFRFCSKNGWIDILYPLRVWNYETCKEFAKQFKLRSEMHNANRTAYDISRKNGWLNEFFGEKNHHI